jgi:hypothetical protein
VTDEERERLQDRLDKARERLEQHRGLHKPGEKPTLDEAKARGGVIRGMRREVAQARKELEEHDKRKGGKRGS